MKPPIILGYIVLAPFVAFTLLAMGHLFFALWILFLSHMMLTLGTVVPNLPFFGPVITRFKCDPAKQNKLWLTIDDGPDPDTTPEILALLKKYHARATFFIIGSKAVRYPHLVDQIIAEGHTIGNHTQNHLQFRFWRLSSQAIAYEIDEFEQTTKTHNWPCPTLFRSPAGLKNPFVHPILNSRKLMMIGWSARAYDTQVKNINWIIKRLLSALRPGAILLVHESQPTSVSMMQGLMKELEKRQYICVLPRLDECD
jgi:peptidoglycan-N-acetylglucosamine deacetylase